MEKRRKDLLSLFREPLVFTSSWESSGFHRRLFTLPAHILQPLVQSLWSPDTDSQGTLKWVPSLQMDPTGILYEDRPLTLFCTLFRGQPLQANLVNVFIFTYLALNLSLQ